MDQYVDTHDAPPLHCSYQDQRDCSDGKCIVGALSSFTMRLSCSETPLPEERDHLKWIIHLIGDLMQPLHVCSRERGGNDVRVKWKGKLVNVSACY